jgi:choline-sulfatase
MRPARHGLTWLLCALMATASTLTGQTGKTRPAARPNVILITVDTLRADHLSAYGAQQVQTPAMDGVAADGILFENAIAQVPLTLASHASILTGTYPFHNGVQDFTGEPLAERFQTVAQAFQRNGYATGAVVSAFVLDRSWGLDRGFGTYYDQFAPASFLQGSLGLVDRRAEASVDQALAWLRGRPAGRPFFLWLHLYDPHSPYDPPEPYRTQYKADPYSGEVAYADAQLGRLFTYLRQRALYDRTAIVLLSDHGESLGEHGEREHGFFVYRSTTHVPLLVKPAGKKAGGRRVRAAVEAVAVAPTLLELAGVKDRIQQQFQTASLLDRVKQEDGESTAYAETYYPFSSFGWSPLRSVQTERYQFIEAPRPELYQLKDDPRQTANVIGTQGGVAAVLKQRLGDLTAAFPPPERDHASSGLSAEAVEKLRSLGYVAYKSPVTPEAIARGLPDPKDRIEEFNAIMEAADAFQAGDQLRGRRLLEGVRAKDPEMYLVPFLLGESALRQKDWHTAAVEFEQCLKLNARFDQALTGVAQAYLQLNRSADARRSLQTALQINPRNFKAWYQLGYVEWRERPADAAEAFREALSIQPGFALAHRDLGLLLFGQREYAQALKPLEQAIALGITDKQILNAAGIAATQSRQYAAAIRHLKAAVAADPAYGEAFLNLGLAYQRAGQSAAARKAYDEACRLEQRLCAMVPGR